jgi:predicted NACHT family NTPase
MTSREQVAPQGIGKPVRRREIKRSAVITEIIQLSDQYRHNKFIVSCRTAVYNYFFENFIEVEMADFGDDSIRSFIFSWFRDDHNRAYMCWHEIQAQEKLWSSRLFLYF